MTVKTSSTPACGRCSLTMRRAASSIAATAALLSAPRIVPEELRTTPSATTGSIGPCGGTVSRCEQSMIGTPPGCGAGKTANDVAGLARNQRSGAVLMRIEPQPAQIGEHIVGGRSLLARRARNASQLGEERDHTLGHRPILTTGLPTHLRSHDSCDPSRPTKTNR